MKIIGLSGKMESGKTTLAEDIMEHFFEVTFLHLNFADGIREKVWEDFRLKDLGLLPEDLKKPKVKAIKLPGGQTIRESLQIVGQAYRDIDPDYWVRKWQNSLILNWEEGMIVIVSNVRYWNEVDCLAEHGAKIIRLTRQVNDDQHLSETALDDYTFQHIIDNQSMTQRETFNTALTIIEPYIKGNTYEPAKILSQEQ